MNFDLNGCEEVIGYKFSDKRLIINAFTHSSYTNEHKEFSSNERLEFLGDSILGYIIAKKLYNVCPLDNEGTLTLKKQALVSKKPLSGAIINAGLDKFLILGEGEQKENNKISISENLFEAIVAAIYLDGGMENAEKFVFKFLETSSIDIKEKSVDNLVDYKSQLLHLVQQKRLGNLEYVEISKNGPPHAPIFEMAVKINGKIIAVEKGRSHKEAEKNAAKTAIIILQSEDFGL